MVRSTAPKLARCMAHSTICDLQDTEERADLHGFNAAIDRDISKTYCATIDDLVDFESGALGNYQVRVLWSC